MTHRKARRTAGFTLTEAMIAIAILAILSSVGPMIMRNIQNFFLTTTARNEIERDARQSLDIMNRMIRQAQDGTIVIDTPSTGGPYSRIRFTDIQGRSVSFYQNGNQLMSQVNTDQSILTKDLVYIAFTFPRTDNPTIVSVALTTGREIQLGQRKVLELTTQNVRVMD